MQIPLQTAYWRFFKPDKAEKMKENALKKVHSIYNWKVITDKTIEVYKNIINESKKANWSMSIMKNKLD